MERKILLAVNGRMHHIPEKELPAFIFKLTEEFRLKVLPHIKAKVVKTRVFYDHFKELNGEQPVVSWFVELTRQANLPQESVIFAAERSFKDLAQAATCGDVKWIHRSIPNCESKVNFALKAMEKYSEEMATGAGNWTTGLEVTKSVTFATLGAAAAVYTGGASLGGSAMASQMLTAGSVSAFQKVAEETGRAFSGAKNQTLGSAFTEIMRSFFTGATIEKITGGKGFGNVSQKIASKLLSKSGDQVLKAMSKEAAEKLIATFLEDTGKSVVGGAIQDASKMLTQEDARSLDKFFDNVVDNLKKGGIEGKISAFAVSKAK